MSEDKLRKQAKFMVKTSGSNLFSLAYFKGKNKLKKFSDADFQTWKAGATRDWVRDLKLSGPPGRAPSFGGLLATEKYSEFNATKIVAHKFHTDATASRQLIRTNWLSTIDATAKNAVETFASTKFQNFDKTAPKILIWTRVVGFDLNRNMTFTALSQLVDLAKSVNIIPVLFGEEVTEPESVFSKDLNLDGVVDLRGHFRDNAFKADDTFQRQLYFIDHLRQEYKVMGIIGGKSGFVDGPGLLGMPCVIMESMDDPNAVNNPDSSRMHTWVHPTVPSYYIWPSNNLFTPFAKYKITDEAITKLGNLADFPAPDLALIRQIKADRATNNKEIFRGARELIKELKDKNIPDNLHSIVLRLTLVRETVKIGGFLEPEELNIILYFLYLFIKEAKIDVQINDTSNSNRSVLKTLLEKNGGLETENSKALQRTILGVMHRLLNERTQSPFLKNQFPQADAI